MNKAGQNGIGKHSWTALAAVLIGETGLDVHKICTMGRWNCSVVIHYTRGAPISDMASGYMQARAARERRLKAGTVVPSLRKMNEVLESTVQDMRDELTNLNEKIESVERKTTPEYVINRNTKKLHRALSSYADAGSAAMAFCGFAFAKPGASTRFETVIPEDTKWQEVCATCLPEDRARLKQGASGPQTQVGWNTCRSPSANEAGRTFHFPAVLTVAGIVAFAA